MINSQEELENIFMSYRRILEKLKLQNITTKSGKEISHKDLVKAVSVMNKKHPTCRWQSDKVRSRIYYILVEGYYWLIYVYFQKNKPQVDADIDFFTLRIRQYEELLSIKQKNLFVENIEVEELENYFDRKIGTIQKALIKLQHEYNKEFKINGNDYPTKHRKSEVIQQKIYIQKYSPYSTNMKQSSDNQNDNLMKAMQNKINDKKINKIKVVQIDLEGKSEKIDDNIDTIEQALNNLSRFNIDNNDDSF